MFTCFLFFFYISLHESLCKSQPKQMVLKFRNTLCSCFVNVIYIQLKFGILKDFVTLYSVRTCTCLASDIFNHPVFCLVLFWTGKSFHAWHRIVVCGEGACFHTASSSGTPSLRGNQNFLPVNLHFFWPQPLRPTDSPVQMFSFAFAAAPPRSDATVS